MKKVAIIGGGIIGQFSAYYLAKAGNEVTVIDKKTDMTPASEGNCGLITPGHVLPLNSKGAILDGIKWLGKKDAPLSIKPQFNRSFISWFLNFVKYANESSIKKASLARHELLQLSFDLYETFFKEEPNQSEWRKDGVLYTCKTEKGMKHLQHEVEVHERFKLSSRLLNKEEVIESEPLLKDDVTGGAMMEMDGWLNPGQLLSDLKDANEKLGVSYANGTVKSLNATKGKLVSVTTDDGEISADEFVLSAGALTPVLARQLNIRIPVIPGKGYNLTTNSNNIIQLKQPLHLTEKKVVATPWKNGFRLGSTMEFVGYDLTLNQNRLDALKRAASEYIQVDFNDFEFTPWTGWRPMKDNGIPVIERTKKVPNLIVATGHSMLGLSMGPGTGFMVNKLVSEE